MYRIVDSMPRLRWASGAGGRTVHRRARPRVAAGTRPGRKGKENLAVGQADVAGRPLVLATVPNGWQDWPRPSARARLLAEMSRGHRAHTLILKAAS
jgi:hypothetical protein